MWHLKISLLVILTINPILRLSKAITTDGCGQTIGCLRVPSGCELSTCKYLATYKSQGNLVTFELLGEGAGWVSIGFSNDQYMPSTDAVLCYNNNSKVEIRSGKLTGKFLPELHEEKELVFINGSTLDDSIQCRFRHPLKPDKLSNLRNLEESVFLLYARGDQSSGNIPIYHGLSASKRAGSSATRVNVTQMTESKATSPSDLNKRIHGSLMVVVWIFLASIGLFFARYTRNIWPDIKLLDNKVWFQFHRSLMIIVVLGTISSIVVIFVDLGRFTKGKDKIKIHAILGVVVFVLAILQPIGALFRPHPDASKRPFFNFIHRLLGLSAFIISLAAIVLGLDIFEKKEAFHAVLGYVGFLGLVILIMEIIKLSWKRNEEETGAGVIPGGMEMQTSIAKTNTTHLTFSKFFLGTLIVVSLAVAVVVIYYINKTDD